MQPMDRGGTRSVPLEDDRRARVSFLRPLGGDHALPLPARGRLVLGSAADCDLVVDDVWVSARHCVLEIQGHRLTVRDLGSKNGTFVNGGRVDAAELCCGGQLRIGRTTLLASATRARGRGFAVLRGDHPRFRAALARARLAASSSCSVLVVGETGTGKELVAQAIHEESTRAGQPFVALNCGAIPGELVESELFGHERGAFTGASGERDGVVLQAHGGTLFLDELGELPRAQQPALLRVLETRRVRRVGARDERPVDFRLVSATNQSDLEDPSSPLRRDLYHRVATVVIELPPLRERPSDIAHLVEGFLEELVPELGLRRIGPATLAALTGHGWPGNVRELRHAVHRAAALSSDELQLDDLLPRRAARGALVDLATAALARHAPDRAPPPAPAATEATGDGTWLAAQRTLLGEAYARHGTIRRAAEALGIPRSTFCDRARRCGLGFGRARAVRDD